MIIFSNCKINLGLRILRKRTDGYHDLETVFYPVPVHDVIEVIRADQQATELSTTGIAINCPADQNLCMKAYALLKRNYDLPEAKIHLHKSIPSGAGLGGGSANAAFTLKLLNRKFNLKLDTHQLLDLALQLGSDCPFFILNEPVIARGRGEIMEPIDLSILGSYKLVLVTPGIHISTAWAFANITPANGNRPLEEVISKPVESWKELLINDFEEAVFKTYPEISSIKNTLYSKGAVYASMSGSGSAVYGLFKDRPVLDFEHRCVDLVNP
ncbi:MAG TPA: 4-(cytidine 5'-diphospho)-2-C-methyl-D-erythritol kinase [Chitinophagaceae bacterium]